MSGPKTNPPKDASGSRLSDQPSLLPCLLLRRGQVCLPSPDGPLVAHTPSGQTYDPFDVVDQLARDHPIIYVVDLDGIERGQPQLDYLQELTREATIWADAGVRNADQAIDVLVAGVSRVILSSATLVGPREVRRAWRLSTDIVFELDLGPSGLRLKGEWPVASPREVASLVREVGVTDLVLSPREIDVDWSLVRDVATAGPVWVDGSFSLNERGRLAESGASGGIFHLDGILGREEKPLASAPPPPRTRSAR